MRLSRTDFVNVVQEAIARTPSLSEKEARALRKIACTAKKAGSSFGSLPVACPAGQAFGYPPRSIGSAPGAVGYSSAVMRFTYAYDSLLRERDGTLSAVEVEDA